MHKIFLFVILVIDTSFVVNAQSTKLLLPDIGVEIRYDENEAEIWKKTVDVYNELNQGDSNGELYEKYKELIDSLEMGYGPLTEGPGCSWYCGGQMREVTASSFLVASGYANYEPENVHDFNLLTAWACDEPIGQKINFHFNALSPRVNEVRIYNGYLKSYSLYKSNSRVRELKLYINNTYYATLQLEDTTAVQVFSIDPVQSNKIGKDLILTFEITKIYEGYKYKDVVISEINFSGLDVH